MKAYRIPECGVLNLPAENVRLQTTGAAIIPQCSGVACDERLEWRCNQQNEWELNALIDPGSCSDFSTSGCVVKVQLPQAGGFTLEQCSTEFCDSCGDTGAIHHVTCLNSGQSRNPSCTTSASVAVECAGGSDNCDLD